MIEFWVPETMVVDGREVTDCRGRCDEVDATTLPISGQLSGSLSGGREL